MSVERITNTEVIRALGLPQEILDDLGTTERSVYVPAKNQFIDAIVNKIYLQVVASPMTYNPFDVYEGEPIPYGDTIENVYIPLRRGYKFDPTNENPFKQEKPKAITLYANINYEMQYKVTIQDVLLRRAVKNEYGLMRLINEVLGTLPKSMKLDHFMATIRMLNNEQIYADGFETIDVPNDKSVIAKTITDKIVNVVSEFQLPLSTNNALKVFNITPKENILLIIKNSLLNSINLDYLAGVYNLSKIDLIKKIIPVATLQYEVLDNPEDPENSTTHLEGEDYDFAIIDTNGFDIHNALEDGGEIYNPQAKYTNHFLNSWKILAFKHFFNARAFKLNVTSSISLANTQGGHIVEPKVEVNTSDETIYEQSAIAEAVMDALLKE